MSCCLCDDLTCEVRRLEDRVQELEAELENTLDELATAREERRHDVEDVLYAIEVALRNRW